MATNPFIIIGLSLDDALDQNKLKAAVQSALRLHHPDKGGSSEQIRLVYEAKAQLSTIEGCLSALESWRPCPENTPVILDGLTGSTGSILNGMMATVISFNGIRLRVRLSNDRLIAVKPENILIAGSHPYQSPSGASSSWQTPQNPSGASSSWQAPPSPQYCHDFGNPRDGEEWRDFGDGYYYPYCWVCKKYATYEHRASQGHKKKMQSRTWL